MAFGTTIGQSGLLWKKSAGGTGLSLRDNANGTVLSTIDFVAADYGCRDAPKLTYCIDLFYGACTSGQSGRLRFFSFSSSGAMQSAVTTEFSEFSYGDIRALTCFNGNSLILVTSTNEKNAYNGFYKYSLSFNRMAVDGATSYQFPSGLQSIYGIATDGSNFYLQGSVDTSTSPPTVTIAKATLGNLQ
jgi:hypothetical protein